jgi:hypothetical protein
MCTLTAVHEKSIEVILDNDPDKIPKMVVASSTHDNVIFDQHKEFLLSGERGSIYCYPLYPANFMSIHKCQGCTITEDLNLILPNTNYQGLYVALSRVTTPKQISRIVIPDQISHLISTIINYPELIYNQSVSVQSVREKMINYTHYVIADNVTFCLLATEFILSTDPKHRSHVRDKIIHTVNTLGCQRRLIRTKQINSVEENSLITMGKIIKYRDVFLALSHLNTYDRNVWVHEFLINNPDMMELLPNDVRELNCKSMLAFEEKKPNVITRFAGLNSNYNLEISTVEYIKSIASIQTRVSDEDKEAYANVRIEQLDNNIYSESTKFCAKVYKRYMQKQPITVDWLIDELNLMLSDEKYNIEKRNKSSRQTTTSDHLNPDKFLITKRRKITL